MSEVVIIGELKFNIPNYREELFRYLKNNTPSVNSTNPGGLTYFYEYDTSAGNVTVNLDPDKFVLNVLYHFSKSTAQNLLILLPTGGELIDGDVDYQFFTQYDSIAVQWDGVKFNVR